MGNKKRYLPGTFHERLRELWLCSNLTQKQIADLIGVDRKSVSKWISEDFTPNLLSVMRLCRLFHVSADYLLFGEEDKNGGQKGDRDAVKAPVTGDEGREGN